MMDEIKEKLPTVNGTDDFKQQQLGMLSGSEFG